MKVSDLYTVLESDLYATRQFPDLVLDLLIRKQCCVTSRRGYRKYY